MFHRISLITVILKATEGADAIAVPYCSTTSCILDSLSILY